MKPILKYPGSKWRIATKIVNLMPTHISYLEPYFGSGAVLFNKPPSPIETICDIDDDVINLFKIIRDEPMILYDMLRNTPYAKKIYDDAFVEPSNKYEKAILFLIRCWQGHGYRTNGYKSGWKQDVQGREKAYGVYDWVDLPERIHEIMQRLRYVQIDNRPAIDSIKKFNYDNVLMYLDPPYVMESRRDKRGQYKHEMTIDDHAALLQVIKYSKAKIIISGYASALYDEELREWNRIELKSNDAQGKATTEVIWMNYDTPRQMTLDDIVKEE